MDYFFKYAWRKNGRDTDEKKVVKCANATSSDSKMSRVNQSKKEASELMDASLFRVFSEEDEVHMQCVRWRPKMRPMKGPNAVWKAAEERRRQT